MGRVCGEMSRAFRLAALVLSVSFLVGHAAAHGPSDPPHQLYQIGDLKLENGESIKDFAISYVTHGKLNAEKSNAILMVTAISGNHHRIDFLIGPGKAIDTDRYFGLTRQFPTVRLRSALLLCRRTSVRTSNLTAAGELSAKKRRRRPS